MQAIMVYWIETVTFNNDNDNDDSSANAENQNAMPGNLINNTHTYLIYQ